MNSCPLVLKSRCPCRCHRYDKSQHTAPLLILKTNGDQNAKIETGIQSIGIQLFELRHDIGFSCLIWNLEVFLKHKKQTKQRQRLQQTQKDVVPLEGLEYTLVCFAHSEIWALHLGRVGGAVLCTKAMDVNWFCRSGKKTTKTTLYHKYWMKAKVSSKS